MEKPQDVRAFFETDRWPRALDVMRFLSQDSNQILYKNPLDDTVESISYHIKRQGSSLRRTKARYIRVEKTVCLPSGTVEIQPVLSLRVLNVCHLSECFCRYDDMVSDITVWDEALPDQTDEMAFNAFMAAILMISKINAGRRPKIDKILSAYQLV